MGNVNFYWGLTWYYLVNEWNTLYNSYSLQVAFGIIWFLFSLHLDQPDKSDTNTTRFCTTLENSSLTQYVKDHTHTAGHILDLVISGVDDDIVRNVEVDPDTQVTKVPIDGDFSDDHVMRYSLLQGSIPGPHRFNSYTSPVGNIMYAFNISFHAYADDLQLYAGFDPQICRWLWTCARQAVFLYWYQWWVDD